MRTVSTGNISLDLLLCKIQQDAISGSAESIDEIRSRYPSLSDKEAREIFSLAKSSLICNTTEAKLVVTAPASFTIRAKSTKNTVEAMLNNAQRSILLTGYSLSDYFSNLTDTIIRKSQGGVFVEFFVNDIENQANFDKICRYKGKFLRIYNYPRQDSDAMSALHAKVITVDGKETLITSANLSYHGQEGNIELGTYVRSQDIAKQLDDFFTQLIFKKIFIEV